MADDFAIGNALETFGQTAGNSINHYFDQQIGAAQHAQEMTLKMLQNKSEQDYKNQQLQETSRHNQADESTAAQRAQQEGLYQQGELENSKNKTADEKQYQQGELAVRGGELDNQRANTASEIGHRSVEEQQEDEKIAIDRQKAADSANSNKGQGAALKAGQELYQKQVADIDGQIKKLNPENSSVLPADTQKKIDDLNKQRTELKSALDKNVADQSRIGKINAPATSADLMPQDEGSQNFMKSIDDAKAHPQPVAGGGKPAPKAAAKPLPLQPGARTATNPQTGEKVQLVNGQWVPVANG